MGTFFFFGASDAETRGTYRHRMKKRNVPFSILVGMALAVLGFNGPILAAEPSRDLMVSPKAAPGSVPIAGNYWALLIGIDDYHEAPKLETAVKDVVGVREVLVGRYGFSDDRVITLINAQATRTNIEHELYKLGQLAKADDSVFIYYAGHGQYDQDGRLGWWVPVEGQPRNPGTFITNSSIRDYIDGMKARHVYLVADSCFSGTLFGKARGMPPINDQFYARLYAKQSRWGLTSGGTEPVADRGKGGHSIFAYHFIGLLKENPEPYLIPTQIYDRIASVIANNASQTPRSEPLQNAGDEGGQFVFRLAAVARPAPAAPALKKGPSAALTQAEQELKTLQAQESQVEQEKASAEEERKLQEIQQQIAQKKQQIAEKKKAIEEARARPFTSQPVPGSEARPREITGKDGATMVVIPAGEFWMGSTQDDVDRLVEQCMQTRKKDAASCRSVFQGEVPRHRVRIAAFAMDKYEVTNKLFAKFVEGTDYQTTAEREGWGWGLGERDAAPRRVEGASWKTPSTGASAVPEHPVMMVSWDDAVAYCRWAAKRLPTEAEWEYAARANTQGANWWGERMPGTRVANVADKSGQRQFPELAVEPQYDDGSARTSPVGTYEANPWGLHDMIGNVWEWTADWYAPSFYRKSKDFNPEGPSSGQYRVVRGGSWRNLGVLARAAYRGGHAPTDRSAIIGFRCAQDAR